MAKLCESYGIGTKGFSPEFFEALAAYNWPGNIRELVNTLERVLVSVRDEPTLFSRHLPTWIRVQVVRASVGKEAPTQGKKARGADSGGKLPTFRKFRQAALVELEQQYLQDLISQANGDIKEACRISGLSRSRLYGLLRIHKISRTD
ncbi:MAG: hypothetical protein JRJ42_09075 [Deltaproteobacteria bacterium]|nr:hypothetical protein [Deltaproteobacteria bacterium]MBW2020733.1 hypothetical protein [Deltaproteobacteria bacterium]MBW2075649.1 hypothetical protein [Deltaproteobacteria bacterium]